jgi:hypothetical protein
MIRVSVHQHDTEQSEQVTVIVPGVLVQNEQIPVPAHENKIKKLGAESDKNHHD